MAGRPPRVSDDAIAKALEKHYGVLAHAARELGMRVDTLHRRIARSPTLQAALHENVARLPSRPLRSYRSTWTVVNHGRSSMS